MKSSLYRIRRNRLPQLPKSRDEVHFEVEWIKTHALEQFLIIEDREGDHKIIIFPTSVNLSHLSESEMIYVDGTFQTCPKLFYQIFTLHSMKYGKQFYCLLPGKLVLGLLESIYKMDSNSPRTNNHIEGWHNKLKRIAKNLTLIRMN